MDWEMSLVPKLAVVIFPVPQSLLVHKSLNLHVYTSFDKRWNQCFASETVSLSGDVRANAFSYQIKQIKLSWNNLNGDQNRCIYELEWWQWWWTMSNPSCLVKLEAMCLDQLPEYMCNFFLSYHILTQPHLSWSWIIARQTGKVFTLNNSSWFELIQFEQS